MIDGPNTKIEERLKPRRLAIISRCEMYRYWLHQRTMIPNTKGWLVVMMVNPSTADMDIDDPTSRRVIEFARVWDMEGVIIVNLFAFRSPDVRELGECENPVGKNNEKYIRIACEVVKRYKGSKFVCAYGASDFARLREWWVLEIVSECGIPMWCFGTNKDGSPKHPLYIQANPKLVPFNGRTN